MFDRHVRATLPASSAGLSSSGSRTAEFLIFTAQEDGSSIETRYEDETIWLTQRLMAELFDVHVRTISEHLGNVFSSGELEREATIRNFRIVRSEGLRQVTRSIDHYKTSTSTQTTSLLHRPWPPRLGWFYGWQRHP